MFPFRPKAQPKTDAISQNSEGMMRVVGATHCQKCDEYAGEDKGHICLDPWLGVGSASHNQSAHSEWMKRHHPSLPISQYTGQPYDPAWSAWVGSGQPYDAAWAAGGSGKTNRATIALMKFIEFTLARRAKE